MLPLNEVSLNFIYFLLPGSEIFGLWVNKHRKAHDLKRRQLLWPLFMLSVSWWLGVHFDSVYCENRDVNEQRKDGFRKWICFRHSADFEICIHPSSVDLIIYWPTWHLNSISKFAWIRAIQSPDLCICV